MKVETEKLLKEKDIKITANRILILDIFLKGTQSLSIADIENAIPWADKATIFRTLKTFEEKALLHAIKDDDRAIKYALCSSSCQINKHSVHPHFHCDVCGKTICLSDFELPSAQLPPNYTANKYSLIINGICSDCQ